MLSLGEMNGDLYVPSPERTQNVEDDLKAHSSTIDEIKDNFRGHSRTVVYAVPREVTSATLAMTGLPTAAIRRSHSQNPY